MTPKELIEHIKSKQLEETVFILGGGPSLLKYLPDPKILSCRPVIAINNAYKIAPDAVVCLFADRFWWEQHKAIIRQYYKGQIVTCAVRPEIFFKAENIIHFHQGLKTGGICEDADKLCGNNGGHYAINLAVNFGFKRIVLIGFDMQHKNNSAKTHWHQEHIRETNTQLYAGTMIPGMEKIVPFQEKLGFTVFNVNPDSAVKCFQFADITSFI